MNAIKATVKGGRLDLQVPSDWPDGTEVEFHPLEQGEANSNGPINTDETVRLPAAEIQFLTEEEQRDDPASVQQWIEELRAIPPLPMTPEQEAEMLAWLQKVKEFNLAAVRKQMEEGFP